MGPSCGTGTVTLVQGNLCYLTVGSTKPGQRQTLQKGGRSYIPQGPPKEAAAEGCGQGVIGHPVGRAGQGWTGASACHSGDYALGLTFIPIHDLPRRQGSELHWEAGPTALETPEPHQPLCSKGTSNTGAQPTLPHCHEHAAVNPPKTCQHHRLLQPSQPCPAETLGDDRLLPLSLLQVGPSSPPGSPACSPAPSPRHRQETTAAACGQLITVTQPHPACTPPPGSVPTPTAPQACTHTAHNGSPRTQCHPAQGWGLWPTVQLLHQDTLTVVVHGHHAPKCPSMLLAQHADPCLGCSSNVDMAGESQSRVGEERVA